MESFPSEAELSLPSLLLPSELVSEEVSRSEEVSLSEEAVVFPSDPDVLSESVVSAESDVLFESAVFPVVLFASELSPKMLFPI